MSTNTGYLFGPQKGKIGGVVAYKRSGQNCLRTYNPTIKDKKTGQQQQNRAAFGLLGTILSLASMSIALAWTKKDNKQTSFSECMSVNAKGAISTGATPHVDEYGLTYYDKTLNVEDIRTADVTWSDLGAFETTNTVAGALVLNWDNTILGIDGAVTDKLSFQLINYVKKEMINVPFSTGVTRNAETYTINYPLTWSNDDTILFILINPIDQAKIKCSAASDRANKVK